MESIAAIGCILSCFPFCILRVFLTQNCVCNSDSHATSSRIEWCTDAIPYRHGMHTTVDPLIIQVRSVYHVYIKISSAGLGKRRSVSPSASLNSLCFCDEFVGEGAHTHL